MKEEGFHRGGFHRGGGLKRDLVRWRRGGKGPCQVEKRGGGMKRWVGLYVVFTLMLSTKPKNMGKQTQLKQLTYYKKHN